MELDGFLNHEQSCYCFVELIAPKVSQIGLLLGNDLIKLLKIGSSKSF